jgi:chemotaxis protein methyltransferase CheR
MTPDAECVAFLRWCLPQLGLRWEGFRKVRGTVCKRVRRRLRDLDLSDIVAYRRYLEAASGEWPVLDGLCRIPISRLYRDCGVFDCLAEEVLPACARNAATERRPLRCWSAGCASGEEAVTLRLLWDLRLAADFAGTRLEIVATDVDPVLLRRAARGCYSAAALKDVPGDLRVAFAPTGDEWCLKPAHLGSIDYRCEDMRTAWPAGLFDLVLCRNLAFTYFASALQRAVLSQIAVRLRPAGVLVLGRHERLPQEHDFVPWRPGINIFQRVAQTTHDAGEGS